MFILEETLATLKKLTVPERWSEEWVAKRNEIKEVQKAKGHSSHGKLTLKDH